jgi:hypothetical protein
MPLPQAARALTARPEDPAAYLDAVREMITASGTAAITAWDRAEKEACISQLIRQPQCTQRPLIFAHEIASHLTSGAEDVVARIMKEAGPVLKTLVKEVPREAEEAGNVILFLLTVRAFAAPWVSQKEIIKRHLEWFERFEPEDLALPYSTMFNERHFGKNRDDLLAHYQGLPDRIADTKTLRPYHVLFLEWLSGRSFFTDPDNQDLESFLALHLPGTGTDIAAARMLVVRHYRRTGVMTPERLEDLGLNDIADLAGGASDTRATLPDARPAPARAGARRLHTKGYQAVQAGKSLARRSFQTRPTARRRLRVAVCVSGQLRGYEKALASWRASLLQDVDATFFVHSWQNIGMSDAQPFRYVLPFSGQHFVQAYKELAVAEGYQAMRARYPVLFGRLATSARADPEKLKALYGTEHVVLDDEASADFAGFSNQQKMHYKIHAADQMAQTADDFDLHMRIRPDLETRFTAFDWHDLLEATMTRPVLFSEKKAGLHYGNLMIGDQFAVSSPATMQLYAGTWTHFPAFAAAGLAQCPTDFAGHVSLALTCWISGISVEKVPVKFGQLVDARPLPSREILDALDADGADDAATRKLRDAVLKDLSS